MSVNNQSANLNQESVSSVDGNSRGLNYYDLQHQNSIYQTEYQHDDEETHEEKKLDELLTDAHLNIRPKREIIMILISMSIGFLISFVDQTGITVALPYIAKDLNAEKTISWAGTAALLSNTVFQVLYGRLSDIFGRKYIIILCLILLSIGDLACGFAKTDIQFFIFRALAGIGNGGVSSLTNVVVSDVVPLNQRGKYQGILGAMVGVGNSIGPFLAAGFVEHQTWRGFFWFLSPTVLLVTVVIYKMVPNTKSPLSMKKKLEAIDYLGFFCSSAALVLILIPLNGGGVTYKWNSSIVISMFTIGGLFLIAFIIIEWKFAKLAMIPLRLFKRSELTLILVSNFFFGIVYYSIMYYIPYYCEIVKGESMITTSFFIMSVVLPQAVTSVIAGRAITYFGHYIYIMQLGFAFWLTGTCLLLIFGRSTPTAANIIILNVIGVGVGCVFQPTLIAVQAQSLKADRAVVITTRNTFRSLGGSVGIAVCSLILGNSMLKEINSNSGELPSDFIDYLKDNLYTKISLTLLTTKHEENVFKEMYMKCIKNIFYFWIPCIAICLLFSLLVKDIGLQSIDQSINSTKAASISDLNSPSDKERSDAEAV